METQTDINHAEQKDFNGLYLRRQILVPFFIIYFLVFPYKAMKIPSKNHELSW